MIAWRRRPSVCILSVSAGPTVAVAVALRSHVARVIVRRWRPLVHVRGDDRGVRLLRAFPAFLRLLLLVPPHLFSPLLGCSPLFPTKKEIREQEHDDSAGGDDANL